MIIVRIVQFVKIVQLVQLDYYGYIKFFGVFVGTWVGAFTLMLCAGAYYSACNGIQVKLPVGAEDYSRLMEELIMKEKSIKNNI